MTGGGQDKGGDMDVGGECGEGKRIGREDNGLFGGRVGRGLLRGRDYSKR